MKKPLKIFQKWLLLAIGCILLLQSKPLLAEECAPRGERTCTDFVARRGAGSAFSSYDSLAMSMMFWGVGLAVGIAGLTVLLNETSH